MFDDIQRYLKPSARERDIKNFTNLRWGVISIEECRDRFVKSNRIPVEIPVNVFEMWLKSEGWLKEEECLEEFHEE